MNVKMLQKINATNKNNNILKERKNAMLSPIFQQTRKFSSHISFTAHYNIAHPFRMVNFSNFFFIVFQF